MSRLMRNIDRFGSPPISGANVFSFSFISPIRSRIGSRTSPSYSVRCASNHCLLLFFASPRRKRNAAGVNAMEPSPFQGRRGRSAVGRGRSGTCRARQHVLHEHQLAGIIPVARDEDEALTVGMNIIGGVARVLEKAAGEQRGALPDREF